MMFQPLDTQNFETSIGMISGVPASRTFSAVEVASLGLHYPIYNEDMLIGTQRSTRRARCHRSGC